MNNYTKPKNNLLYAKPAKKCCWCGEKLGTWKAVDEHGWCSGPPDGIDMEKMADMLPFMFLNRGRQYDLKKSYAEGETIEVLLPSGRWSEDANPKWDKGRVYRVQSYDNE